MKNILTLLLSFAMATAVVAQTHRDEAKSVILGQRSTPATTSKREESRSVVLGRSDHYPTASREQRTTETNRDYEAKIHAIENNRRLSPREKERQIRTLEAERSRKIDAANANYGANRHYDNDEKKVARDKGNNGNHYGWQKGKGNPHKD